MDSKKIAFVVYIIGVLLFCINQQPLWLYQILFFCASLPFLDIKRPLSLLTFCLIFFTGISAFLSKSPITSVPLFFATTTALLTGFWFEEKHKKTLIYAYMTAILIGGGVSAYYSLLQTFSFPLPGLLSSLNTGATFLFPSYGHAFYVIFVIAIFPFILEHVFEKKGNILWLILSFYGFILFLTSFSKAAMLVGAFQIAVYLFFKRKNISQIKMGIVIGVVGIIIGIGAFSTSFFADSSWIDKRINKSSVQPRVEYWRQSIEVEKNASVKEVALGFGQGTFKDLSFIYQKSPERWSVSPHNLFLELFIEYGIVGGSLFIGYIGLIFWHSRKKYSFTEIISLGSLVGFSLVATYSLLTFPILLFFFTILHKHVHIERKSLAKSLTSIVLFAVGCFWFIYACGFILILLKPSYAFNSVHIFPYEKTFWTVALFQSSQDEKNLNDLSKVLNTFGSNNILKKELARAYAQGGYNCKAIGTTIDILKTAPYDLEAQILFTQSLNSCKEKDNEVKGFITSITPYFVNKGLDIYKSSVFLGSLGSYAVKKGWYTEGFILLRSSWQGSPWELNPYLHFPIINLIKDNPQKESILQNYLDMMEQTNYKKYDSFRKKTANEWYLLGQQLKAKDTKREEEAYLKSIAAYPYTGYVYFELGEIYKKQNRPLKLEQLYKTCLKNFSKAAWCSDLQLL